MRALTSAIALVLCAPLSAQDQPTWRPIDEATGEVADVAGLEQLARDFPDSTSARLRLLGAQLAESDGTAALASLEWLAARGHVFSDAKRAQIPELIGEGYAEQARALMLPTATVITASEIVATVPAEAGLVESVLSPVPGEVFLVSSVTERAIYVRSPDGEWQRGVIERADDLSGMVADDIRNAGWIASGNIDGSSDSEPRLSGLIRKAASAEETAFIGAPTGVTLSDLGLGPDGAIYASDPMGGGIYGVPAEGVMLEVLVPPGTLRSPQGLAVSADGARLYVSDYRYGLAMVDLASGDVSRVSSDVPAALDGIDGLWLHGKELIAVQNGVSPMRISAFALSDDGTRITGHRILEQAHPEWTEPLGGSISDGALYYIGTGQWDRYDKGVLREGMEAIPSVILRLPLNER